MEPVYPRQMVRQEGTHVTALDEPTGRVILSRYISAANLHDDERLLVLAASEAVGISIVLARQVRSRAFFKEGRHLYILARRCTASRKVATPFFTTGIGRSASAWTVGVVVSLFALAALLCHVPSALATTYYVSATGSDSNSGTSTTAPFLTIQKAANLTKPGDIANVVNGTYGPFTIPNAGSQSGGYITYQAYPGQHPTILKNGSAWNGILISDSTSYIVVAGFTVLGNAQSITANQAQSAPDNNYTTNGNCIGGHSSVHHVKIHNNTVSYCPEAGIMLPGDYVWIYSNVVHHNSFWSPYATSGITVQGVNSHANTATKIFVYNNRVSVTNTKQIPAKLPTDMESSSITT
jgi:hypothetical protein